MFTDRQNINVGLRPSGVLGLAVTWKSYAQVKSIQIQNKHYTSPTSHFWTCHEDWHFIAMMHHNSPIE